MFRPHALIRLPTWPSLSPGLRARVLWAPALQRCTRNRHFYTLGIETSCDDTCVAIMKTDEDKAQLLCHHKISCANKKYEGIYPIEAIESHTRQLPGLIQKTLRQMADDPIGHRPGNTYVPKSGCGKGASRIKVPKTLFRPDLIAVTRGPGIKGCLSVGISAAKALSVALGVPIIGVHHMQAHALTPQMEAAMLRGRGKNVSSTEPKYPFLTLLVSGGHTTLAYTTSSVDHRVLASTARGIINPQQKASPVAVGTMLDKCARAILPPFWIPQDKESVVYAKLLECYVSFSLTKDKKLPVYEPPRKRDDEIQIYKSEAGWAIPPPLRLSREMKFDFSGFSGKVQSIMQDKPKMLAQERAELGYHTMRLAFEHLGSRLIMALQNDAELRANPPEHLVLSGGVAQNRFLREVLSEMLKVRGFGNIKVIAPNPIWCADNAAMIAWTGAEMYHSGWTTDSSFLPKSEWPIEQLITDTDCWINANLPAVEPGQETNGQQATPSAQETPQAEAAPEPSTASNVSDAEKPSENQSPTDHDSQDPQAEPSRSPLKRHRQLASPFGASQASKREDAGASSDPRLEDVARKLRQLQREREELLRNSETKAKDAQGPAPRPEPSQPPWSRSTTTCRHLPLGRPTNAPQPSPQRRPWKPPPKILPRLKEELGPPQAELLAAESRLGASWTKMSPAPTAHPVPVRAGRRPPLNIMKRTTRAQQEHLARQEQQACQARQQWQERQERRQLQLQLRANSKDMGGEAGKKKKKEEKEEEKNVVRPLRPLQSPAEKVLKPAPGVSPLQRGLSSLKRWVGL